MCPFFGTSVRAVTALDSEVHAKSQQSQEWPMASPEPSSTYAAMGSDLSVTDVPYT